MEPIQTYGYALLEHGKPLQKKEFEISPPADDEAVVRVAGCGLCHTDISFYTGPVEPNQMPVILGHEISGTVVAAGGPFEGLVGRGVVVPAVLPCGDCELCRAGRGNICRNQKFPGNDFDGGFASYVKVPARFLCPVPEDTGDISLAQLSVIADAITTPYQALVRSGLADGELAVVVGVGGIGTYMVQHARNAGAVVVALDVDDAKLDVAGRMGAAHTINVRDMSEGEVKKAVRGLVKEHSLPALGWRVFETSGTGAGQRNAFALLSFAGTLAIVGFTMEKVEVRLSNAMAFDADIFGNWACKPEHYPTVVDEVLGGRINVRDNVVEYPLDQINDVIDLALRHELDRRAVLVP